MAGVGSAHATCGIGSRDRLAHNNRRACKVVVLLAIGLHEGAYVCKQQLDAVPEHSTLMLCTTPPVSISSRSLLH